MSTLPEPGTYVVDPVHSTVGFVVRHLVAAKVRGHFEQFEGNIVIGDTPEASSVTASVVASSITTGNADRDGHLKSPDFFDVENHPNLTFTSTKVTSVGGDRYQVEGDLSIRGVTKPVAFDLVYNGTGANMAGGKVAGFEATLEIDRRDFNVSFSGALEDGSLVVANKVKLELDIEAHK